jgi:transcription elongation factor GreA
MSAGWAATLRRFLLFMESDKNGHHSHYQARRRKAQGRAARLKTIDRPAVINAIAEARAQGDLSENAEYDAAKDRQGFIEGRIQEIEGKLSAAQIIDPSALDAGGKVVFGATVELEDEDTGDL